MHSISPEGLSRRDYSRFDTAQMRTTWGRHHQRRSAPGFVPPQVTIVSAKPSTDVLMVRSLGSMVVEPRLSGDDVLYWRSDIF